MMAKIIQKTFDYLLDRNNPQRYSIGWLLSGGMRLLYLKLASRSGQSVRYSLGDIEIILPASHALPFKLKADPNYSKCLGRIASAVARKYPDGLIVDIGANVGDSAAVIRSHGVGNRMVCIEGAREFFPFLERNAEKLGNIITCFNFIGSDAQSTDSYVRVLDSGNAVVYDKPADYKIDSSDARRQSVQFVTLSQALGGAAASFSLKLLKTDVEGFDLPVLNANMPLIREHLPLIFMELFVSTRDEKSKGVSWRDLWSKLRTAGYSKALYWQGSSDFLCMLDLNEDQDVIEDLHDYLRDHELALYADVCLVHQNDVDVAALIRDREKTYFKQHRMLSL